MNILIGTDILLYYLQKQELVDGMNMMFKWIDRIGAKKIIDVASIAILTHFTSLTSFDELKNYEVFKQLRPKSDRIGKLEKELSRRFDSVDFDYKPLFAQLNWLFYNDADYLITENRTSHNLAKILGIDDKVLTIEDFIEKCSIEHRDLDETVGVAIRKVKFCTLDYNDRFFNSFKYDYEPYYHIWFKKKGNDEAFIAADEKGKLRGLLKLKFEDEKEDTGVIEPKFGTCKRLKISSLKADFTSQKLGQRFMRIVFETALKFKVDEIYITLFPKSPEHLRLVNMIEQWGFVHYGYKDGNELVFVRDFRKKTNEDPKICFPYHSSVNGVFIVPIYRSYASQLLPPFGHDVNDNDVEPNKRATKKVLILHKDNDRIKAGSILLFFQKSDNDPNLRFMLGVGVVENVYRNFHNESQFMARCRKRSILNNASLMECWTRAEEKPIAVEFLYAHYFDETITSIALQNVGVDTTVLHSQCPTFITREQFHLLIKHTIYAKTIVVD